MTLQKISISQKILNHQNNKYKERPTESNGRSLFFLNITLMKRFVLILILTLSLGSLLAKERTGEEKLAIARSYLTKKHSFSRAKSLNKILELKTLDALSVFGYSNGGFVIVSNDDTNAPVLGYSDNKTNLESPDLMWYLNAANQALQSRTASSTALESKEPIEPLLKTSWGQDTPYNNLCPTERENEKAIYPTGCVATAMAQVMYYHQYPEKGTGNITYSFQDRILSADFNNTYYQWNLMTPTYKKGEYSDESALAVATLMYQCGVSIKMQYNTGGSGAYSYNAATALRKNFGYHKNLQIHYRDYYTTKEWINKVYDELKTGRPIIYTGVDESNGGHCFVLDGFDQNNFVHVNWGWDGVNDGYYDIALLNPTGNKFSTGQTMLSGVDKPTANIEHHSEIVTDDNFKVTKLGSSKLLINDGKYANLSDQDFSGFLGIILEGNGKQYVLSSQENKSIPNLYYLTKPSSNLYVLPIDLADGIYRVYAASKDDKDKNWNPVHFAEGNNNSYILEKSNKTISLTPVTDADWHETTAISNVLCDNNNTSSYVVIYNSEGQLVCKIKTSDFQMNNIPGNGLFILKCGNKTMKIVK